MQITVIGRGRVGGALARRWTAAGHDVTALGRDGGDATGADVVVVAIPGDAIAVGLAKVAGLDGQVTIDASNIFGDRPPGYDSIAQQVKAIIGGPTSKAFNTNFAPIYDAVDAEPMPPGTLSRPTPRLARPPSNSSGRPDSRRYTLATWRRLRCWKVPSS